MIGSFRLIFGVDSLHCATIEEARRRARSIVNVRHTTDVRIETATCGGCWELYEYPLERTPWVPDQFIFPIFS